MSIEHSRNILLVEPNYKNKYPPIGLMKISTYHRMLNDNVTFYKGDMKDFAINMLAKQCIYELQSNNIIVDIDAVQRYIKTRRRVIIDEIVRNLDDTATHIQCVEILNKYKNIYRSDKVDLYPKFDRIYVSTLFTFYWDITIYTINYCKKFVNNIMDIYTGGVMATVLQKDLKEETGITPLVGLIDRPGILDDNDIIVDTLPLDYSILYDIDYKYPMCDAYYGYLTRGCIRHCPFCAVRIIEPLFHDFISFKSRKQYVDENFGEQRNMLLLDNNVLASKQFNKIIDEIVSFGFGRGAVYKRKNNLPLFIGKIFTNKNTLYYHKRAVEFLYSISFKSAKLHNYIDEIIAKYGLQDINDINDSVLCKEAANLNAILDKYFAKLKPVTRYVDFNQGVDARLINEENMQQLGRIAIRPLRIAFDSIKYREVYEKAVRLAAKNGIVNLSNYVLYNEKDSPEELYERLRINIDLCKELNISIYSFPMKYLPIEGKLRFNRNYLGEKWNRKFVRAIQTILNATKGKVGRGQSFFSESFGATLEEFMELLYMPEAFILNRKFFRDLGLTEKWRREFYKFQNDSLADLKNIIATNNFSCIEDYPQKYWGVLKYYTIKKENIIINFDKSYGLKKLFESTAKY